LDGRSNAGEGEVEKSSISLSGPPIKRKGRDSRGHALGNMPSASGMGREGSTKNNQKKVTKRLGKNREKRDSSTTNQSP